MHIYFWYFLAYAITLKYNFILRCGHSVG